MYRERRRCARTNTPTARAGTTERPHRSHHGAEIAAWPDAWGAWRSPESEPRVVPEVARRDVLELACGEEEVFTFGDFPEEHRREICSTNPFENVDAYGLGRHPD